MLDDRPGKGGPVLDRLPETGLCTVRSASRTEPAGPSEASREAGAPISELCFTYKHRCA